MRRVAYRATESVLRDVQGMLRPTCVRENIVRQIVAFPAHRVRTVHREIRIRIKIRDQLTGRRRLAELIPPLQQVGPLRSMRTVRPRASELAVVVAVVAIAAKQLCPYQPARGQPGFVQHIDQQAGLR